jgi:hypothetical protein
VCITEISREICQEDARATSERAPETTRNVAISRKGQVPKGISLSRYFSRACMRNCELRNGHKYGAYMARTLRNIRLKGASSPLLKHHDRQTAEHSQRNRWAQLAVSTGTTASCAVARAALDVRAVAAGRSAFASERPFSAPFSALSAFPTSSVFNSFLTV